MLKKLAMKLGMSWLGRFCRDVAEGRRGPRLKRLYVLMIGKKRIIGVALGCVTAGLLAVGETSAVEFVTGTLALIFLSAGAIDANWRSEQIDSAWLRFLRQHAVNAAALLAIISGAFATCAPGLASRIPFGLSCADGSAVMAFVSAVVVHLGISAEAQAATPPAIA